METNQIKNFICKFCSKRFPCGKSLGGHIRIHFSGSSTTGLQKEAKLNISESLAADTNAINSKKDVGPGQSSYVLRENPKKTSRFVADSSNINLLQEKLCKECGKGFQSLKALCGHMACHSRNNFEDNSGTTEKLKELVMDSQSDTETSAPRTRRRSERMRYKTLGVYSSSLSLANGSLSSASDVEHEQEEVAVSLMMLSRDSGFKGCFSSVADSSDNNSVVLEAKSSSTKMRIKKNNGLNCVYKGNEFVQMKAKQGEGISTENDRSENSDPGHFRSVPKMVESDSSGHGFSRNDQNKKHKVEFGARFDEEFDAESGKRLSRFRRVRPGLGKDLIDEDGHDQADRASVKYDSRKRSKLDSYNPEFLGNNAQERGKCFSLGGRGASQKKSNGCSDSIYESGENSNDTDYAPSPVPSGAKMIQSSRAKNPVQQNLSSNEGKKVVLKKGKVHECPYCPKVFRSGQALGGHKRSHVVGGSGDRTMLMKQEVPEISMPRLIDLNIPVTAEEEAHGFMPW